jgi:uncharacterized protein YdeI (YjbR/CyaY-like superfamily)
MTEKDDYTFCPAGRQQWRAWLMQNHACEKFVWLVYYKKKADTPSITWSEAVDEALCFGWIDSLAKPLDEARYMQYFTRRKPGSVWSKINKEKVQRLTDEGLMTQAGLDVINLARENGSWTLLDEVEELIVPADLQKELDARPGAEPFFLGLSRSDRRNLLQWVVLAKRPQTRQNRILEIADQAALNQKPGIIQLAKKVQEN